jgi:hypothetical protein
MERERGVGALARDPAQAAVARSVRAMGEREIPRGKGPHFCGERKDIWEKERRTGSVCVGKWRGGGRSGGGGFEGSCVMERELGRRLLTWTARCGQLARSQRPAISLSITLRVLV